MKELSAFGIGLLATCITLAVVHSRLHRKNSCDGASAIRNAWNATAGEFSTAEFGASP